MVYDISVGNFLFLAQSTGSKWKIENPAQYIPLQSVVKSNLIIQNVVHPLYLTHLASNHKNIIIQEITQNVTLSQLTHPKSSYFEIIQTIPLGFGIDLPPYGPVSSNIELEQIVSYYVATPAFSQIALTQTISLQVIRLIEIEQEIGLTHGATIFLQDKRWIPNRGDFIPPNAEYIWDINVKDFVKIPGDLAFNPATGYYEGTNIDSFFVQSNGYVLWP